MQNALKNCIKLNLKKKNVKITFSGYNYWPLWAREWLKLICKSDSVNTKKLVLLKGWELLPMKTYTVKSFSTGYTFVTVQFILNFILYLPTFRWFLDDIKKCNIVILYNMQGVIKIILIITYTKKNYIIIYMIDMAWQMALFRSFSPTTLSSSGSPIPNFQGPEVQIQMLILSHFWSTSLSFKLYAPN